MTKGIISHTTLALSVALSVTITACGGGSDKAETPPKSTDTELLHSDSAALKIAVMPVECCLPAFLVVERGLTDKAGLTLKLVVYNSQMDQDTAIARGHVEGMYSDSVRVAFLKSRGEKLTVCRQTNAYWLLVSNKLSRINRIEQLSDKIIAQTCYSAIELFTQNLLNATKTTADVYKVQVNDVNVRYNMLLANNIDALWLPEPYASAALSYGHKKLADSRKLNAHIGVIAFADKAVNDKQRKVQIDKFLACIDEATDSISIYGASHYADVAAKYFTVKSKTDGKLSK